MTTPLENLLPQGASPESVPARRKLPLWIIASTLLAFSLAYFPGPVMAQAPATQKEPPVVAAYYYKIKWGYQDEFLDLFRRNHFPVLQAQVKTGRLLSVEAFTPKFHGDGRADWNFVTILVFRDWQAFGNTTEEAEIIQRLYPDQAKYKKEEERRFELLDAHWDVPLVRTPMP